MLMALALSAMATPVPPDLCPVFERLVAAARERPTYSSIRRALADGQAIVPGFAAADCAVEEDAFSCRKWTMGANGLLDWPEPVSCPGFTSLPRAPHHFRVAFAVAAPGGLEITYGVRCFRCAGPGTAYFRIGRREREGRER